MLIDLHCHTRVYSACSALTPDALVRAARARGLDGVVLTEHDALWPLDEIERMRRELDFVVLRGVEVTTDAGHVLVYGLHAFSACGTLDELSGLVEAQGALMFLAHPGRSYGTAAIDIPSRFASVESQNGTEGLLQNDNASAVARRCALPGIGGSDAHSVREAGVCATRFGRPVSDEASLMEALRAGAYSACRLPAST